MKNIIYILLVAALTLGSCVTSEQLINITEEGEERELVLNIRTPQSYNPASRQLSEAQEKVINRLTVLVFKQNFAGGLFLLSHMGEAETLTLQGVTTSGTITLSMSALGTVSTRFVVLANMPPSALALLNANYQSWRGLEYEDVASQLIAPMPTTASAFESSVTAASPSGGFPMCGQVEQFVDATTTTINNITLTRSLARVDVGVGNRTSAATELANPTWNGLDDASTQVPFRLEDVRVYSAKGNYRMMPALSGTTALQSPAGGTSMINIGAVTAENITGVANNRLIRGLYIPETYVPYVMGGTLYDDYTEKRIAVVVGGYFDEDGDYDYADGVEATKCYYRIDFANYPALPTPPSLMTDAVMRNTIYRFSIVGVLSRGANTPEGAYEAKKLSMEVKAEAWDLEDMDDVPLR